MYIYHVLINTLSTHIIHINLNMIFYTHVEHSPTKNNLHQVLYGNTHSVYVCVCIVYLNVSFGGFLWEI